MNAYLLLVFCHGHIVGPQIPRTRKLEPSRGFPDYVANLSYIITVRMDV